MTLSKEDSDLFYALWFPLLDFVNDKYKVEPGMGKMTGAMNLDSQKVKNVADRMWEKPKVIEEYVAAHPEYPQEHKDILLGYTRRVSGMFYLERHLKGGSIFLVDDDDEPYGYLVSGIISSWEEMFFFHPVPILLKATLIPFKKVIISDGLVMPYNVFLGPGIKKRLKENYRDAKAAGRIYKTL